jgi:DNA helicase-2/ATP-dependent DNA helicase PcrA
MSAKNHPAFKEEAERCRYTVELVKRTLESSVEKKKSLDTRVESLFKHYSSDSSQDYIDLLINTTLQEGMAIKIRKLADAVNQPYFARIDFKEDSKETTDKLYIGKVSLSREEDQELIIIDWRAPVSSLYYEERLGPAHYDCPEGRISGELKLKRQFTIEKGALQDLFDIDITTNDQFLQAHLGANADNRLKDIVSTIQAEQNRIIRADMWTPLIVQGAAGSGKTTIALHRIAYLAYTHEKTFKPENFMIIAPNRLFLNYISNVLPELGVENVKQTTFEDFAAELIGKKIKIRDANEKLNSFVNHDGSEQSKRYNELLKKASEFKTSMAFKDVLDDYMRLIEESYIPEEDFKVGPYTLFSYGELNHLFLNEYRIWPFAKRINEIKKNLNSRIKLQKDAIINSLHDECDVKLTRIKREVTDEEERRKLIIDAIDNKNSMIDSINSVCKTAVSEYIKKIAKPDPLEIYKRFVKDKEIFKKIIGERLNDELSEFTRAYTLETLNSGFLEIEDIAPVTYIKFKVYGIDEKIPVRHIIVDEAQDFSVFQLHVLKNIIKDSSFTILGDICQGIHSYRGIRDWDDIIRFVFDDRNSEFLTLEQSYRTTVEIMEAANKVIEKSPLAGKYTAKPVIRHGESVKIIKTAGINETSALICKKLQEFIDAGYKTAAVICKTMEECREFLKLLKRQHKTIHLITGKEQQYHGGLVVVPSYLAKGLEFDGVIIANANSSRYTEDPLDVKLLYTAMTRPLHQLVIYCHGNLSPLLL